MKSYSFPEYAPIKLTPELNRKVIESLQCKSSYEKFIDWLTGKIYDHNKEKMQSRDVRPTGLSL